MPVNPHTPLPIGESFFDRMIEGGYYYVDKTLFIRDLLEKKSRVTLCTRPRRFGKTLNQTMLKCFFENTAEFGGRDTSALFKGLKVEKAGEKYMEHQGKYPVIFLSLKEAKRDNFENSYTQLKNDIASEFKRHKYVKEKIADIDDKELFEKIASGAGSFADYSSSIKTLSKCLENYYDKKAVILIDEYDVPLENSWVRGFYQKMIDFMRPLLSSSLKDNPFLEFAVLTGCLRISKESIFTGLNNLDIISILNKNYSECFGFTQDEMDAMLKHYGFESKTQIVKEWYDGYVFGKTEVYNPWSSIKVVSDWLADIDEYPKPHWANTSGNDIVRKLIDMAGNEAKTELGTLVSGGYISKTIHEDITYNEIENSIDNIWNFLFFTGYLKKIGEKSSEEGILTLDLSVPNMELMYIYKTKIQEWFKEKIRQKDFSKFYAAIMEGNVDVMQAEISEMLMASVSYMDFREDFYHGFMLGILSKLEDYSAKSNRESGSGRSDVVLRYGNIWGKAVIFEFKFTKNIKNLESDALEALEQIERENYVFELEEEGYKKENILKYGIAFYKKNCLVKI
jgi:hypothetical protein